MKAGEENFIQTKFYFWCENDECSMIPHKFIVDFDEPPLTVPANAECPECGKLAELSFGKFLCQARSSDFRERVFRSVESRKSYTKEIQQAEIKNSQEILEGKKGISPYSKYEMDYEYFEQEGTLKRVKGKEVHERIKRSQNVAKAVEENIDKTITTLGKRPNG
jgi:hypothetical protein